MGEEQAERKDLDLMGWKRQDSDHSREQYSERLNGGGRGGAEK